MKVSALFLLNSSSNENHQGNNNEKKVQSAESGPASTINTKLKKYDPTYHFLFGAQHTQLPKAHVERRALVGAISLANDHHIDAARQRSLVYAFVQFFDGYQHLTSQLAHIVHGVGLDGGQDRSDSYLMRILETSDDDHSNRTGEYWRALYNFLSFING